MPRCWISSLCLFLGFYSWHPAYVFGINWEEYIFLSINGEEITYLRLIDNRKKCLSLGVRFVPIITIIIIKLKGFLNAALTQPLIQHFLGHAVFSKINKYFVKTCVGRHICFIGVPAVPMFRKYCPKIGSACHSTKVPTVPMEPAVAEGYTDWCCWGHSYSAQLPRITKSDVPNGPSTFTATAWRRGADKMRIINFDCHWRLNWVSYNLFL